jgi:hypothetical protein
LPARFWVQVSVAEQLIDQERLAAEHDLSGNPAEAAATLSSGRMAWPGNSPQWGAQRSCSSALAQLHRVRLDCWHGNDPDGATCLGRAVVGDGIETHDLKYVNFAEAS